MKDVAAVIVTYNRKDFLKKCIKALLEQEKGEECDILVIDNASTDGTKEEIVKYIQSQQVIYINTGNNLGGAGGFHKMFELLSVLNKFDYIWTMDDDVLPENDCLEKLLKYQDENTMITVPNRTDLRFNDKACINMDLSNPFKIFMKKKTTIQGNELSKIEVVDVVDMAFEGPLINSKLLSQIGLPDDRYFIQFDDTDYATRALNVTKIKFIVKAILHKQIIPIESKDRIMNWKSYYSYRNDILFCRKYGKNFGVKYVTPVFLYINLMIKAIFKKKWKNIKIINKAFFDGYIQKCGKTINPGEL